MFTTFVINLDKDVDRLTFMSKQLDKLGISYRRQSAFFGKTHVFTDEEYSKARAVKEGGRELIAGELGCALSHATVYRTMIEERLLYALILEDDIMLPPNFKSVIDWELERQQKNGFEYLLFDYVPVGWPFVKQWLRSLVQNFKTTWTLSRVRAIGSLVYGLVKACYILPLSLFEGLRNRLRHSNPGPVRFFRPVYFAGCYLLSLEGAQKLDSLTHPIIYTADQLPNRARVSRGLRFYCYSPLIVRQKRTLFGSSILDLTGEDVSAMGIRD